MSDSIKKYEELQEEFTRTEHSAVNKQLIKDNRNRFSTLADVCSLLARRDYILDDGELRQTEIKYINEQIKKLLNL